MFMFSGVSSVVDVLCTVIFTFLFSFCQVLIHQSFYLVLGVYSALILLCVIAALLLPIETKGKTLAVCVNVNPFRAQTFVPRLSGRKRGFHYLHFTQGFDLNAERKFNSLLNKAYDSLLWGCFDIDMQRIKKDSGVPICPVFD